MLDYDVVIIGGTITGIYAAITATKLQGRVALVQPSFSDFSSTQGFHHNKIIGQIGNFVEQIDHKQQFGIYQGNDDSGDIWVKFEEAKKYADYVVSNQLSKYEPAILGALGIDVIFGEGKFVDRPNLAFVVKGRHLRSRTYLLAIASQPIIPPIPGLTTTKFITPQEIKQLSKLPQSLVVIGGDPSGVEIAQSFSRLGSKVTMVVKSSHILGKEDSEAAFLVQAQLEAEGIRILTNTEVSQAREIDDKKWILVGNEGIETDEIILAAGNKPEFESLNLEAVGVRFNNHNLLLNQKLQTTNSRIYACGDLVGGYSFSHIANYEAKIALKNILYFPIFKVDYHGIPWAIFSEPQLARVGLTEAQARRRYGENILVCRQYFKSIDRTQILDKTTGFCKFIGHRNGKILGVSVVGIEASEIVHIMALAIRQEIKMEAIADLPHIWPTVSEINAQTAAAWLRQKREGHQIVKDWLENLFHWRRSFF
ncbi:MAG: NAD(P)/FAD-dependent oxidoreductase [Okeania sp. SIO2G4]|uniref:dihydrolipoyl dehydrogenase family protein n=1 Tax=unclassified Okeania TaxID=2634635 RepID=UPI0013BBC106|nr:MULTISPECIES: NAD(P)/FAD-dependent oxidoreductase [unclassified Okeania]NEP39950.1 NAD(P)/FAD-dependent oxidoreductase [Okeania sp. SIO2H7]NEP70375.1 NAD(P)/FAD-dependent oxidoreductase [Okeania sp. SIO2G5]NEP91608.1 NAD(P)/FAD-dependent oxidoreductase [Okeania sp. SIO2F5]NEQ89639.1 NAD(P)/FAD-dependent oxidoreductase [Okeania sp. SIO2G4]